MHQTRLSEARTTAEAAVRRGARWFRVGSGWGERGFNLALQGGGVLGAFTWGVLDRLLEDPRLRPESVSGASAGAVNAVLLAAGWLENGREGARSRLAEFWGGLGATGAPAFASDSAAADVTAPLKGLVLDLTTRLLSPYQANPFGFNPLRERLGRIVDFPRLARESPLRLWVAALEIESGCLRLFRREEISLEVVLASAALPHLHHAVEIEGRHYWDGGYLANPPLLPLIAEGAARATLIVKLLPETAESIPRTTSDISERLAQILFAEPLRREIALVGLLRGPLQGRTLAPRLRRRLAQHRLYLIDGGERLQRAVGGNLLIPDAALIARLYEEGRAEVAAWLARPRAERRLRLQAKFTA